MRIDGGGSSGIVQTDDSVRDRRHPRVFLLKLVGLQDRHDRPPHGEVSLDDARRLRLLRSGGVTSVGVRRGRVDDGRAIRDATAPVPVEEGMPGGADVRAVLELREVKPPGEDVPGL